MIHKKDYTTADRFVQILIVIGIIVNLIVWGLVGYNELTKPEPETIPMANQNISWEGAGYNGYYKGGN